MDTLHQEFIDLFGEDLRSTERARQIYAALCNQIWSRGEEQLLFSWRAAGEFVASLRDDLCLPLADPEICERCGKMREDHFQIKEESGLGALFPEQKEKIFLTRWGCDSGGREEFIGGYTGPEDYMDYYCTGGEGEVAPWVRAKLQTAGYKQSD